MVRVVRFIAMLAPAIFVSSDAISTYFALTWGKGTEVNVMMANDTPLFILAINITFAITLLVICIYLDRKLHKTKRSTTRFLTMAKNILNLNETDKLVLIYATLLSIATIRSIVVVNNLLVLNDGLGLIVRLATVLNVTNYSAMLLAYGVLFVVVFPLAVILINKIFPGNMYNETR